LNNKNKWGITMKNNQSFKLSALSIAMLSGSLLFATSSTVYAAESEQKIEEEVEVINVTGSRIKRSDLEGASPVTILTRADLDLSGATNIGELINKLPAVTGTPGSENTGVNGGTASFTLRGLSANNTLVLIDGRRSITRGASATVDLNSIPFEMVDRIEVLKDGASAIYGSDAIAGVLNVIMLKEYDGIKLDAEYGISSEGDAANRYLAMTWGASDEKSSIVFSASQRSKDGYGRADRRISANSNHSSYDPKGSNKGSSRSPHSVIWHTPTDIDGNPATRKEDVAAWGSSWITGADRAPWSANNPYDAVNDFRDFDGWRADGSDGDEYNYASLESASNDLTISNLFVNATYELTDDITLFSTISANKNTSSGSQAPAAITEDASGSWVSPTNQYNPFGTGVRVRRRITEGGTLRPLDTDALTTRFVIGLEGELGEWGWDAAYSSQSVDVNQRQGTQIARDRVGFALGDSADCLARTDGCVPLDVFGAPGAITEEMRNYIFANKPTIDMENKLSYYQFNIAGPVLELPAGALQIAAGAEYREESGFIKYDADANKNNTAYLNAYYDTEPHPRDITEFYLEANIPLLSNVIMAHSLELDLAVRTSDYSDFGRTTNPKYAMKWRPVEELLIRGSYTEGFRAPTFGELYAGQSDSWGPQKDPCWENTNATHPGCFAETIPSQTGIDHVISGGNADLTPETAESLTYGVVWTPGYIEGLSVTLDAFNIKQDNVISSLDLQTVLDRNAETGTLYADKIHRDVTGRLEYVEATGMNLESREIQGFDWEISYKLPDFSFGQISLAFNGSHLDKWVDDISPDDDAIDYAGHFSGGFVGAYHEDRMNFGIQYAKENFNASWTTYYLPSVIDDWATTDEVEVRMDSYMQHDIQMGYFVEYGIDTNVTFGVLNLLDEEPPFTNSNYQGGFEQFNYSSRGRFMYFRLSKEF